MRLIALLILLSSFGIAYCIENDTAHPTLEELVVFPEKKVPWNGLDCEDCHLDPQKMTTFDRYEFYIDEKEYRATAHGNESEGNATCVDCHLLQIPVYTAQGKEYLNFTDYCPPPRIIGGFGSNATYHTVPNEGCVNKSKGCHWTKEVFFTGEHFLEDDKKKPEEYWNSSHKDYKPWYCEGCHAYCGSCHWKGPEPKEEEEFRFDFLDNVKKHEISRNVTSEICAICHHGEYNYSLESDVIIEHHPQYEEWKISVHNDTECKDCHRNIHGATYETGAYGKRYGPTTCGTCHTEVIKSLEAGPHIDVACESCHSTWLPIWQDPESLTFEPKAIIHNKTRTWPTHEIRKKEEARNCDYCHGNTTTQEEYSKQRKEAIEKMNKSINNAIGARATALLVSAELKFEEARAAWAHVSPEREHLTEETIALAKEAKMSADLANFIAFLAYLAVVLGIIGLILVVWPYD
jgi:hypothetical protein